MSGGRRLTEVEVRGHELGHLWARERAGAVELDRLREFIGRLGAHYAQSLQGEAASPYRATDYLAFAILGLGEDEYNYVSSAYFWENTVGCAQESDLRVTEFLQGFVDGALEVEHVVVDYGTSELD